MRYKARLLFCALPMAASIGLSPCAAQDINNSWGGLTTNAKLAAKMKTVCSDQDLALTYAGYMLGYHTFDTGTGDRVSIEKGNALAQEIIERATITDWTYVGWSGGSTEGRCAMHFALTMAPQDAAHFNNDPQWGGDVIVNMTRETGEWTVQSFADAGARSSISGWFAAWLKERDLQPGGAPRLKPTPSPQQLALKINAAQACASHWEVSDDLFPAYNAWLETLGKPSLLKFKVGTSGRLEAGRMVSSSNQAIVCRYNIGTGTLGGNVDRSIHDLDVRFTLSGGRPKWEVVSFPSAPVRSFTSAQNSQLMSQIYIDGKQLQPGSAPTADQSAQPATPDWDAIVREANR